MKTDEVEDKEYAFFLESCDPEASPGPGKKLSETVACYLMKLCAYENESLLNPREKLTEENATKIEKKQKKFDMLVQEIREKKKSAQAIKKEFQRKSLSHLGASDEELYLLLKDDWEEPHKT